VSNYRVRQVLALGPMPDRRLRLLVALATRLSDDSRTVRVGFDRLIEDTGNARNTVRTARRELEGRGDLLSKPGGRGRGDATHWTVLCLPEKGTSEVDPLNHRKRVNDSDPVNEVDPLNGAKGVNGASVRGSIGPQKGGQPEFADLGKSDLELNRRANPSSSGHVREAELVRSVFPSAQEDEIEAIVANMTSKGARSPLAVIRHQITEGTLRLPCDTVGRGSHSTACRRGDGRDCSVDWCACRCHLGAQLAGVAS
jgi:hypothetical protein